MSTAETAIRTAAQQLFAMPQQGTGTGTGVDANNPYNSYWPQPHVPQAHPYNAHGGVSQSTWGITKGLIGRSLVLEQMFVNKVLTSNDFIFEFMPMVQNDNMNIRWSRTIFSPTLVPVVPQRGHVRVLQSRTVEGNGTQTRHALGMQLSQDFMTTDRGLREFVGQSNAISRSIVETLLHESLMEVLAVGTTAEMVEMGNGYDAATMERFINWNVANWAIFQKETNPLERVDTEIEELKIRGGAPTNIRYGYIVDRELPIHLAYSHKENTDYYLRGPGAHEGVVMGPDGIMSVRGKPLYRLQHYDIERLPGTYTATRLNRQIGEAALFLDEDRGGSYQDYTTIARGRNVYSEDRDTVVHIKLEDMFNNSGRFDADGNMRNINSPEMAENADTSHERVLNDPFHYRRPGDTELRPIDYLGNQFPGESETDPDAHILARDFVDAAKSIIAILDVADAKRRWANVVDVVKQIRGVDITSDASIAFLTALNAANPGSFSHATDHRGGMLPSADVEEVPSNIYGFLKLPTTDADAWTALSLPPGFQSYPGLKTIAEAWKNSSTPDVFVTTYGFSPVWAARVSDAVDLIEAIVKKLEVVAPGARFIDPDYVSSWFTDPNAATAFVENLLTGHGHPLFLVGSGGPGVQVPISAAISAEQAQNITPDTVRLLTEFGAAYRNPDTFSAEYAKVAGNAAAAFPVKEGGTDSEARSAISTQLRIVSRSRLLETLANMGISSLKSKTKARGELRDVVFGKVTEMFGAAAVGGATKLDGVLELPSFAAALGRMDDRSFNSKLNDYAEAIVTFVKDNASSSVFGGVKSQTASDVETKMSDTVKSIVRQQRASLRSAEDTAINSESFAERVGDRTTTMSGIDAALKGAAMRRSPLIYTPAQYMAIWNKGQKMMKVAWPSSARNADSYASVGEMESLTDTLASSNMDKDIGALDALPAPLRISNLIGDRVEDTAVFDNVEQARKITGQADYSYYNRLNASTIGAPLGDYYGGDLNSTSIDFRGRELNGSFPGVDMTISDSMRGNFAELFKRIHRHAANDLHRVLAQAYLSLPAKRDSIMAGIHHNVAHLFNYIFARPHAQYETATLIQMAMDGQAGNNYYANPHVLSGQDPHQGLFFAQVAFWNRPLIHDFKGVFLLYDSFVTGYIGGLGTQFFNEQQYAPIMNQYGSSVERKSAMSIMIPRNFVPPRRMSLTGFFNYGDSETHPHYPSYQFENRRWRFHTFNDSFMSDISPYDQRRLSAPNLVLFTGPYWNPTAKKMEKGNGHWNADYTYPGARDARVKGKISFKTDQWNGWQPVATEN